MLSPPIPPDEAERLAVVRSIDLLDKPSEHELDDLVRIASEVAQTPIALASLIDEHRQWVMARVGLDVREAPRSETFCAHTITCADDFFVVPNAANDERFSDNPSVVGPTNVRFYAATPLRLEGHAVGALCVVDRVPRDFTPTIANALLALRRQVEVVMTLRLRVRQLAATTRALEAVQVEKARLVQFVAHDIHNALGSLLPDADYLATRGGEFTELGSGMKLAAERIRRLSADLMDLGRLESGSQLTLTRTHVDLEQLVATVFAALRRQAADRSISLESRLAVPMASADAGLLERVLFNLVDNALRHAPRNSTVSITTKEAGDQVVLEVNDTGPGVPESQRDSLFELYERGTHARGPGRGIGLAFCRSVVVAHQGRIWVEPNTPHGSRFCLAV